MANLTLMHASYDDFQSKLHVTYDAKGEDPPAVSEEQYREIQEKLSALLRQWGGLAVEDSMDLPF